MGLRLLLLFVVVPLVELTLLVRLGEAIGLANTILIIVLTGVVGTALARRQGMGVWRRFNERVAQGQMPGNEIMDGLIILVCGALLMTPGVLTDVVGLLGLIPVTRNLARDAISSYAKRHAVTPGATFSNISFGQMPNESARRHHEAGQSGNNITQDVEEFVRDKQK